MPGSGKLVAASLTSYLAFIVEFINSSFCVILSIAAAADASGGSYAAGVTYTVTSLGFLLFASQLVTCCYGVRRESFTTSLHGLHAIAVALLNIVRVALLLSLVLSLKVGQTSEYRHHATDLLDAAAPTTRSQHVTTTSSSSSSSRSLSVCRTPSDCASLYLIILFLCSAQTIVFTVLAVISLGSHASSFCYICCCREEIIHHERLEDDDVEKDIGGGSWKNDVILVKKGEKNLCCVDSDLIGSKTKA